MFYGQVPVVPFPGYHPIQGPRYMGQAPPPPPPSPGPAPAPAPAPTQQAAPPTTIVTPPAVVTGPWYRTIWYQPAVGGVPIVPVVLGLGVIAGIAAILSASSRPRTVVVRNSR
jgi:hypothetical protein